MTVAVALLLDSLSSTFTAESWVLRVGGATASVVLCVPVFRDRARFRAAVVGDRVVERALDDGALTSFGLAIWIFTDIRKRGEGSGIFVAIALVAGIPAAIIYALVRIGDKRP